MKITVNSASYDADGFDNLLSALRFYGFDISSGCNGTGICGQCKVLVDGKLSLACQTKPYDKMVVELPSFSDKKFPSLSKKGSAVVDIGTTTVTASLVCDGKIITSLSEKNSQSIFGADVISRIEKAEGKTLTEMNRVIISQVNSILKKLSDNFTDVSIVGNTAMLHIFLNVPCISLGVYPYTPPFLEEKNFKSAKDVGLDFDVPLKTLPCISAFCGADIFADICEAFEDKNTYSLLIDFGTNAELALFNKNKIFVTSAAAGPAFEGGKISSGIAAVDGAICSYKFENNIPVISTINKKAPLGICGSGLIDIISELVKNNIIDKSGYIKNDYKVCKNIYIKQGDVRELQFAISAVRTAVDILTKKVDNKIDRVYLCGSFGNHINIDNAKYLSLIPKDVDDVRILKNAPVSSVRKLNPDLLKITSYIDLSSDKNFLKIFNANIDFY